MEYWKHSIPTVHPAFRAYAGSIDRLPADRFPGPADHDWPMGAGPVSGGGQSIRFVSETSLTDDLGYEERIFTRGLVSTRSDNWHDFFNALVWRHYPATKVAFNSRHREGMGQGSSGTRGSLRDAITLFDECGVVLCSTDLDLLQALANRDWEEAFVGLRSGWPDNTSVRVLGHAMLEKFLAPYKSMTAQALLVHWDGLPDNGEIDQLLARRLLEGKLLSSSSDLSPVPLQGIPGWSTCGEQDAAFYADTDVFRPPSAKTTLAPVHRL